MIIIHTTHHIIFDFQCATIQIEKNSNRIGSTYNVLLKTLGWFLLSDEFVHALALNQICLCSLLTDP